MDWLGKRIALATGLLIISACPAYAQAQEEMHPPSAANSADEPASLDALTGDTVEMSATMSVSGTYLRSRAQVAFRARYTLGDQRPSADRIENGVKIVMKFLELSDPPTGAGGQHRTLEISDFPEIIFNIGDCGKVAEIKNWDVVTKQARHLKAHLEQVDPQGFDLFVRFSWIAMPREHLINLVSSAVFLQCEVDAFSVNEIEHVRMRWHPVEPGKLDTKLHRIEGALGVLGYEKNEKGTQVTFETEYNPTPIVRHANRIMELIPGRSGREVVEGEIKSKGTALFSAADRFLEKLQETVSSEFRTGAQTVVVEQELKVAQRRIEIEKAP